MVILQKAVHPPEFVAAVILTKKLFNFNLIFDFDDASYLFWPKTFAILSRLANTVIVGSDSLYEYAKEHNSNVVKIPTVLDVDKYNMLNSKKSEDTLNLIWVGTITPQIDNLKILVKPFRKLQKEGLHFTFTIVSSSKEIQRNDLKSIFSFLKEDFTEIPFDDWSNTQALANIISKADVGVMPLINSEFNRGKCAFKLIEYMACGVVAMGSSVGENTVLIENNKDGILCSSEEDWYIEIKKLNINKKVLKHYSDNAYVKIKNNYSVEAVLPTYIQIMEQTNET